MADEVDTEDRTRCGNLERCAQRLGQSRSCSSETDRRWSAPVNEHSSRNLLASETRCHLSRQVRVGCSANAMRGCCQVRSLVSPSSSGAALPDSSHHHAAAACFFPARSEVDRPASTPQRLLGCAGKRHRNEITMPEDLDGKIKVLCTVDAEQTRQSVKPPFPTPATCAHRRSKFKSVLCPCPWSCWPYFFLCHDSSLQDMVSAWAAAPCLRARILDQLRGAIQSWEDTSAVCTQ